MNILKYKYKAHKFINYIFYAIVFFIGFFIGFGANKIDFNKLINQVLMIDNVYAYDVVNENHTIENVENFALNNIPSDWKDEFNFEEYPYVILIAQTNIDGAVYVYFLQDLDKLKINCTNSYCSFFLDSDAKHYYYRITYSLEYEYICASCTASRNMLRSNFENIMHYTNFNIADLTEYSNKSDYTDEELNELFNVLDFNTNLEFNENLFKDNSDFKQVCIEEGQSFVVTPSQGYYSDNGIYEDFIWFPYGLSNGIYKTQYDSSSEYSNGYIIPYPEETMREHFYFSSKETIDSFYDTDLPSDFEEAGYTNKYSYYGYDAYKIFVYYKDGVYRYPIFTLDYPSKTHISTSGNVHGGGGLRLDGDDEIEISDEYCFYVKNEYNVSIVNINEWNDYNGTVSSPDGDYDFNTSHNEFNSNTDSFLSQPIKFINSIKDTLNFIGSLIYDFYMSLPVLLRTFIVTVFIILIVMLIMKIGGYK